MKLLLDTHIWVWAGTRPEKLTHRVRRELQRKDHELYLSPVSVWEAHHLVRRGRLRIKQQVADWIEQMLAVLPVREALFTIPVGLVASRMELSHADPGDVFLAATAVVYDLTLVTSDAQLLSSSWLKTLRNG